VVVCSWPVIIDLCIAISLDAWLRAGSGYKFGPHISVKSQRACEEFHRSASWRSPPPTFERCNGAWTHTRPRRQLLLGEPSCRAMSKE
jgi:hypothetical protein